MIAEPKPIGPTLTFVIRDDAPMIHCGDSPSYRTVTVQLTDEQREQVKLFCTAQVAGCNYYEQVSRVISEPEPGESP